VGSDRAAVTALAGQVAGAAAGAGPAVPARHPVRALHRYRLGRSAAGAGLRLRDDLLAAAKRWSEAGVFEQLHLLLLSELNAAGRIDWSRAAMDGSHIDAKKGVPAQVRRRSTGASPVASII
jgi:hypothetical protein